jgi:hypothetical protein
MDVSIVLVKDQNPQDLTDLKANLNVEFEYVGNELSIPRLKLMRCALKYERSHVKGLWEKNPSSGPPPKRRMAKTHHVLEFSKTNGFKSLV